MLIERLRVQASIEFGADFLGVEVLCACVRVYVYANRMVRPSRIGKIPRYIRSIASTSEFQGLCTYAGQQSQKFQTMRPVPLGQSTVQGNGQPRAPLCRHAHPSVEHKRSHHVGISFRHVQHG